MLQKHSLMMDASKGAIGPVWRFLVGIYLCCPSHM